MQRFRKSHRLFAWIAICAVLLSALAPAVSRAMSSGSDQPIWVEICTMAGMVRLPTEPSGDDASGKGSGLLSEACPYCCPHADSFALPPLAGTAFNAARLTAQRQPLPLLILPPGLPRWSISPPRAPPALS